ncbi:unnamed protein product, partial [Phaeothamnion confervicola]
QARILADRFDDVVPREIALPDSKRKRAGADADLPHVSTEKSEEGLAAVYEKEYLRRALGVAPDDPKKKVKEELQGLFAKLCRKLDALSNFAFAPRPPTVEAAVTVDVPAIAMEEALPMSVADADALAPEEASPAVYAKKRGRGGEWLEGGAEMDRDERKRLRGAKKTVRRRRRREADAEHKLVARINPGLGNKYERDKMLADIRGAKNVVTSAGRGGGGGGGERDFNTSAKFFSSLQAQVRESVSAAAATDNSGGGNGGGSGRKGSAAARLRL